MIRLVVTVNPSRTSKSTFFKNSPIKFSTFHHFGYIFPLAPHKLTHQREKKNFSSTFQDSFRLSSSGGLCCGVWLLNEMEPADFGAGVLRRRLLLVESKIPSKKQTTSTSNAASTELQNVCCFWVVSESIYEGEE